MFSEFETHFHVDQTLSSGDKISDVPAMKGAPELSDFFARHSGMSFNAGLYRVVNRRTSTICADYISIAFPRVATRLTVFGYDWLGRIFVLDPARSENGGAGVSMFEPGTGQAHQLPCNIKTFHNREIIAQSDAALASGFHKQWSSSGNAAPTFDQCVGYKQLLFLGGLDNLNNLELSDLSVYLSIASQLISKARGLKAGR